MFSSYYSLGKKIIFLGIILFLFITLNLISYFVIEYYKDISYPTYVISSESKQMNTLFYNAFPFNSGFLMTNGSFGIHQVEYYDENLLLQSKINLSGRVLTTSNKFISTTMGYEYPSGFLYYYNKFMGESLNNSYTLNLYNQNLQNEFNITVDREYKNEISLNFPFMWSSINRHYCKIVGNYLIIPEITYYPRNGSETTFEVAYQNVDAIYEVELVVINLSTKTTNIYTLGMVDLTNSTMGSSQLLLQSSSKFEFIYKMGLQNSSIVVQSFTLDIKTKEVKESKRVFNDTLQENMGISNNIIGIGALLNEEILIVRYKITKPIEISEFENQTLYFIIENSVVRWDSGSNVQFSNNYLSIDNSKLLVGGDLRIFDDNHTSTTQSWMSIIYYYNNELRVDMISLHNDKWIESRLRDMFEISRNKFGVLLNTIEPGSDNFYSTMIIYKITPSNFNARLQELPSYMKFIIPSFIALLPSPLIYRRSIKRKSVTEDYPIYQE